MNTTINDAMKSAAHTADDVKGRVAGAASDSRDGLLAFGTQALKFLGHLREMEVNAVDGALDRVGLQRRQSVMTPVAWLAAGAMLGGAAALVLAPDSGKGLRRRLARFLDSGVKEVEKDAKEIEQHVAAAVDGAKKKVNDVVEHSHTKPAAVSSSKHGPA